MDQSHPCSRRRFLAASASAAALTLTGNVPDSDAGQSRSAKPSTRDRKPIAVITTVYRPMSHAFHIAGRFMTGYTLRGERHLPKHYVHTMFVHQKPDNDLSKQVAREHEVRLCKSIAEALTEGSDRLTVEGVLLIGEHGNYPRNEKGQVLYPRYDFMKEIVEVFRKTRQSVPVFNDKHLSYSWAKSKEMVAWSRELKFPLMAGSSLPVTWRRPELELKLETPIEDALVAAYGPIEIYGFHALETLQVMMERRKGGETGIKAVTCLTGKEVWKAGDQGRWSWDLLDAALARSETVHPGDVRHNTGAYSVGNTPTVPPTAFLLEYRDGTRGTVLLLNGHVQDFTLAAKIKGESKPASTLFYLPSPPGARYFDALVMNIEKLLETGKSPYPVERTLLTSGALDALMEAHRQRNARVETPELEIKYTAPADSGFIRGNVAG